jgi:hypothetical protein
VAIAPRCSDAHPRPHPVRQGARACLASATLRHSTRVSLVALGRLAALAAVTLLSVACNDTPDVRYTAVAGEGNARAEWSVVVGILDENAQAVDAQRVTAESGRPGMKQRIVGARIAPGRFVLEGSGPGPLDVFIEAGGRRHTLQHPIESDRATLVLPVGGRLEISWSLPRAPELFEGRLMLVLESSAEPRRRLEQAIDRGGKSAGAVEVGYLAPGEYLVSLELWKDGDAPGGSGAFVLPLTAPRLLQIEAGEITRVPLGGIGDA